ncbi:hypothetical protein FSP39_024275 [Pinctada imbricata]|uniref:Sulfotransferase domain-containing protein n=1 Tax=Pinctada imbricata TaxID=66713 RepID=A0AA88Y4L9_PINIB|nr:hypothetical protein FSP39_024275 [Pinctada imbricata]
MVWLSGLRTHNPPTFPVSKRYRRTHNSDVKLPPHPLGKKKIGNKVNTIYSVLRQILGSLVNLKLAPFDDSDDTLNDENRVLPVLVLAYLRSGSTFTAAILQEAPRSFYVFEPLLSFFMTSSFKTTPSCTDPNYFSEDCREAEVNNVMLGQMSQFYSCNYSTSFFEPDHQAGRSNSERYLYDCIRTKNNTKESCFLQTKEMCFRSRVRIIKTIRMSLRLTKKLFEKVPNLKIIHLIRDPRGVIGSRQHGDFMTKNNKGLLLSGAEICQRYMKDIEAAHEIEAIWPNRIKRIYYEKLATNSFGTAKEMFEFLGIPLPVNIQKWIHDHTSSKSSNDYYGTHRSNTSNISQKWRKTLNKYTIKNIDKQCEQLYKITGYMYKSLE